MCSLRLTLHCLPEALKSFPDPRHQSQSMENIHIPLLNGTRAHNKPKMSSVPLHSQNIHSKIYFQKKQANVFFLLLFVSYYFATNLHMISHQVFLGVQEANYWPNTKQPHHYCVYRNTMYNWLKVLFKSKSVLQKYN